MKSKKEVNYVKATKEGRLYIKTSDFFKQAEIRYTIKSLLDSDIIKEIEERKIKRAEKELQKT